MSVCSTVSLGDVPLKWPQNPLASIASLKQIEKAIQFRPVGRSLGTDEGRISVVVNMADDIWTVKWVSQVYEQFTGPIT